MVNGCHASPEAYKPAGAAQARKGRCPAFGRRGLRGKGKARRMGVMRPGTCTGTAPQAGQKKEGAAVRLDKFTAKALGLSRSEARAAISAQSRMKLTSIARISSCGLRACRWVMSSAISPEVIGT